MKHLKKTLLSLALSGAVALGTMAVPVQAADTSPLLRLAERAERVAQAVQGEKAISETLTAAAQQMTASAEAADETAEAAAKEETAQRLGFICGGTINVRSGPGTDYDRITQVSSGKKVTILGEKDGWYQISFDSVTGYVRADYLHETDGSTASAGAELAALALSFLGTRYVSGGASPDGFDCSGLTRYLYGQYGYSLPHSATAQYKNYGVAVAKEELQPGDLVFFSDSSHAIGHVSVYIGGGQMVHARYSVGQVRIDDLSANYYVSHYVGAKRLF